MGNIDTRSCLLALTLAASTQAATLPVGPGQPYSTPCAAIAAAFPGDTIEIHPSPSYPPESCPVSTPHLTLRAADPASPRPSLPAAFTIAAPGVTIEGLELHSNPDSAAIHVAPGATLTLRNAYLHDNLAGLSAADSPESEIAIQSTEFARNRINTDIGRAARFTLRFSYSHHATTHLIRSRALENHILYNRLTQESRAASLLLVFPSGSRTRLTGNLIQRPAPTTCGPMLQSESGELILVSNTIVNPVEACSFVQTGDAAAEIANNLLAGPSHPDADFLDAAAFDYRLQSTSPAINSASELPSALQPEWEYVHPLGAAPRHTIGAPDLGAFEFGPADPLKADPAERTATTPENQIVLSSGSAPPGATADVNLFLFNVYSPTAAAQWTLDYPAGAFTAVTVRPGPSAPAAKAIHCSPNNGRTMTCILSGYDATPVKSGIVAIVSFKLAANAAAASTTPVTLTRLAAATATGDRIQVRASSGRVYTR